MLQDYGYLYGELNSRVANNDYQGSSTNTIQIIVDNSTNTIYANLLITDIINDLVRKCNELEEEIISLKQNQLTNSNLNKIGEESNDSTQNTNQSSL